MAFDRQNVEKYSLINKTEVTTYIAAAGFFGDHAYKESLEEFLQAPLRYSSITLYCNEWKGTNLEKTPSVGRSIIEAVAKAQLKAMTPQKVHFNNYFPGLSIYMKGQFERDTVPQVLEVTAAVDGGDRYYYHSHQVLNSRSYYGGRYTGNGKEPNPVPRILGQFRSRSRYHYRQAAAEDPTVDRVRDVLKEQGIPCPADAIFPNLIIVIGDVPAQEEYWLPKRMASLCHSALTCGKTVTLVEFGKPVDLQTVPTISVVQSGIPQPVKVFTPAKPSGTEKGKISLSGWGR